MPGPKRSDAKNDQFDIVLLIVLIIDVQFQTGFKSLYVFIHLVYIIVQKFIYTYTHTLILSKS